MKDLFKSAYIQNRWLGGQKIYTVREGYKWLVGEQENIDWFYWVWSKANIPKHAFISWLVTKDRQIKTRKRMQLAGLCRIPDVFFVVREKIHVLICFFQCDYGNVVCHGII